MNNSTRTETVLNAPRNFSIRFYLFHVFVLSILKFCSLEIIHITNFFQHASLHISLKNCLQTFFVQIIILKLLLFCCFRFTPPLNNKIWNFSIHHHISQFILHFPPAYQIPSHVFKFFSHCRWPWWSDILDKTIFSNIHFQFHLFSVSQFKVSQIK